MRALVDEPIIDPEQRIVDPHHHHLWPAGPLPYDLDDLLADLRSGHRVERTVFMECRSPHIAPMAPAAFAPVGETEWVAGEAQRSGGVISGIVGHADLRLPNLDEILGAHTNAGRGLFRGIRDARCHARSPPTGS